MKVTTRRSRSLARIEEAGELSVFVKCHDATVAIATRWVERLVLAEEGRLLPPRRESPPPQPGVQLAEIGGRIYAAWDLGKMLELPPQDAAWVLLRIPHAGRELPLALRTGVCLIVQPLHSVVRLPAGLYRSRRLALSGAYPTRSLKGRISSALVGLRLDPLSLWTPQELDASAAALAAAEARQRSRAEAAR